MNVFLPIKLKPTGGTSTFARNFKREMERRGHRVLFEFYPSYNILLASPRAPVPYLIHAKMYHKPIIHRLDGVYSRFTVAGNLYPFYNIRLRIIRNKFADYVIYQSKFSKHSCDTFLGSMNTNIQYSIIYNGVDTSLFSKDGDSKALRENKNQKIFITASHFRREDQIAPLLRAFVLYQQKFNNNSKLYILGDFMKPLPKNPLFVMKKFGMKENNSVRFVGPIPHHKLPTYYRGADVFVFTHRNPPCPNNVLEAMACGLPICGIADGAMPELVREKAKGSLLSVDSDPFESVRDVEIHAFAQNMHKVSTQKHNHRNYDSLFTLDHMIDEYLQVFECILQSHG